MVGHSGCQMTKKFKTDKKIVKACLAKFMCSRGRWKAKKEKEKNSDVLFLVYAFTFILILNLFGNCSHSSYCNQGCQVHLIIAYGFIKSEFCIRNIN